MGGISKRRNTSVFFSRNQVIPDQSCRRPSDVGSNPANPYLSGNLSTPARVCRAVSGTAPIVAQSMNLFEPQSRITLDGASILWARCCPVLSLTNRYDHLGHPQPLALAVAWRLIREVCLGILLHKLREPHAQVFLQLNGQATIGHQRMAGYETRLL